MSRSASNALISCSEIPSSSPSPFLFSVDDPPPPHHDLFAAGFGHAAYCLASARSLQPMTTSAFALPSIPSSSSVSAAPSGPPAEEGTGGEGGT